jgi:mono/diheme cytochrome c family protein
VHTLLSLTSVILLTSTAATAAPVDFNKDIRPILSSQCYSCHGNDDKTRKEDLRLDLRDEAVTAKAIVPGKPDESELLKRIISKDSDEQMPPPKSKKPPLTAEQIDLVKRWIAEGANYSDHWSFTKITRPAVPAVKDAKWGRNPIDAFLLAKMEAEKQAPSPEANRITLIRRLSLDLTGLPPSVEDVRAFVVDQSPNAFEKVVDKFLASPHYGERMAVQWLDLVRYADSIGYHSDNPMNVSPYRDYVIRAFNENLPFDQFTREQLAGDLLPNPTQWQKVATAYNRLLQTTQEGGAQAKEYEAKNAADRVRNYGQVWLGGTVMCAECHNHKFDPYSQKDFYTLAAFFADVKESAKIADPSGGTPIATKLKSPSRECKMGPKNP